MTNDELLALTPEERIERCGCYDPSHIGTDDQPLCKDGWLHLHPEDEWRIDLVLELRQGLRR